MKSLLTTCVLVVSLGLVSCSSSSGYLTPYANTVSSPNTSSQTTIASSTTSTVPKTTAVVTFDQLKSQSVIVNYQDLFRNIEQYVSKQVYYTGQVIQVTDLGNNNYVLRVDVTPSSFGFWSDDVYVHYSGTRLLENDIIEFVGKVLGTITYQTVLGAQRTIPELTVLQAKLYTPLATTPINATSQSQSPTTTAITQTSTTTSKTNPPTTTASVQLSNVGWAVTEQNSTWWRVSWKFTLANPGIQPYYFNATIQYLDVNGFEVDDDLAYGLSIPGSSTKEFTGSTLVTASTAPKIIKVVVNIASQSYPPATTTSAQISNVGWAVTEQNSTWWRIAWKFTITNSGAQPYTFNATIQYLNVNGFEVDNDLAYALTISGNITKEFTGSTLVTTSIAPNVTKVVVTIG